MKIFTRKIAARPRRWGFPRRRLVNLGEPKDNGGDHSGSPRRSVAYLGKPLRLGDECKTHLCFEFISLSMLCILYP